MKVGGPFVFACLDHAYDPKCVSSFPPLYKKLSYMSYNRRHRGSGQAPLEPIHHFTIFYSRDPYPP